MGKIKKILENELVGGTQSTDVYPVTSTKAVYDEDNENLDSILKRRGTINVSTNYNADHTAEVLTLSQAIAKVPSSDRVLGFTMTFLSSDGWKNYQFIGTTIDNWTDINNWTSFVNDAQLKSNQDSIIEKLDTKVNTSDIVQQTGNSTTSVMSQKAVSHELSKKADAEQVNNSLYNLEKKIGDRVVVNGNVTNLPDEEDLTSVKKSEHNVIRLADRSYAPEKFSGKGYKILRKNIVDGNNILTQDMINEPNTIYEIRYDFDLNGQEIIVPDNCVLKFEGGYLSNGTLLGELCFSGDYIDVLRDISLQKIKNVSTIDYRYIFSNSLNNIFVVKNSKDLTKAINAYNSASDEQYWVITNTIVTDEITLTGTANLTIIGCNNAELIYATSVYSVKKSDNILDCIHNSYKLSNYDLFHDDFSSILFSGEKDVYSEDVDMQVYEYNDGIYSSLGSSSSLYSTITNDNNRYAGFKLSDMLLNKLFGTTTLSECNLSVEKCVNIKLDYTTGYWNYRTSIHSINNGYVYFKNTNSEHAWYTYNGDAFYNTPMRYSIINCILLKDSETITIDENNILYSPMSSVNLYRTDEGTSLFNIAKDSTVDILNLTIKYAYYAVNSKRTTHIKNCKFLNNFIALYLDGATNSTIKSNKFLNSYASALQTKYSDNTSFIFNEVKNSGLIDRNRRYAVNFSYSNNGLIAYNSFVNFYTAIGLTAGREHLENKYNCAAICYNKLCIEEDYINNLNSITDYGVIYLAPFQKGTCSINGVIYNRSKIHANIICNSCGSYKGYGIYLDDGAYNTSVTDNYVIGVNTGITMRTVASASNPYNNTNNEVSYNIVVNGIYNVGKPAEGDDNWNINYNFIVTNSPYYSTFTNLSAIEENKFLIVRFFSIKENVLYIPTTLFYHLFYNAKVDWFISKNIAETNIGSSSTIKESAVMSTRAKSNVPANSKYLKINIQGVTTNNLMYEITIITYFSVLKLAELSYDPIYKQFRYVTNLNGDTFKAFYYKYDEENQILQLLIESNKTNAFDTLKVLALSYFSGTLQPSSSAETTSISYINGKLAYPCSMLSTYYEGLDDVNIKEWTVGCSIYEYASTNRFINSNICFTKHKDLMVTIDDYNDHAPKIPYIFSSVNDAKYGRNFDKILYYKNKALIQGYAIDEDKTQYKEYDLLGKPILSESGTFEQKPTVEQGVGIGFAYFCTNKQTEEGTTNGIMIYHKGGNVWVDALGRVVS